MWKCFLFIVALIAAAAVPSITPAAVMVNISNPISTENVGSDVVATFEVFGTDLDGSDERLNAYTIAINGFGTIFSANGVHFVVPGSDFGTAGKPTQHPYVFKELDPVPPVESFSSTPTRLQIADSAVGQLDEANIENARDGFFRFSVVIPANAPRGSSALRSTRPPYRSPASAPRSSPRQDRRQVSSSPSRPPRRCCCSRRSPCSTAPDGRRRESRLD